MKYIKLYEEFNSFELNEEQKAFLDKYAPGRWKLNNGLVDIDGDFDCSNKNLTSFLEIKFGKIGRDFDCGYNQLTSLQGCPTSVGGDFECSDNQLTSLQGCPASVGGDFECSDNQLTSLQGCPTSVGGDFECIRNQLISLQGCPTSVGGDFYCSNNKINSLQGCPTSVGRHFFCYDNELISLIGCPTSVGGKIHSWANPISAKGIDLVIINTVENKDYQKGLILSLPDLNEKDLNYLIKDLEYSEEFENIIRNNHKSELLINNLKEYNKPLYDKLTFVDKEKSTKMHDMGFND